MPAGKIEQHDAEQDREQTLSWNTRQRQNNAEGNQQNAAKILADDLRSVQRRIRSGPELRFAIFAEMVRRQFHQNQRDDSEIDKKGCNEDEGSEQYVAPAPRQNKFRK